MHITFDTNVIGPLACPDLYSTCPDMSSVDTLRKMLRTKSIHGYMSEASMSLEAISNDERVDTFLRQWASKAYPIQLPEPSPERQRVFSEAYKLDIMVLHAPRIALGSFIEVPESCWASDANYGIQERQDRYHTYIRNQTNTGSSELKQLGAELVTIHGLSTNHLSHLAALPSWPTAEELMWMQGLLAEYDNPKKFSSKKKFLVQFREVVAEWFDMDIQASHYAYGFDFLCTLDSSKNAGSTGIMHPNQIAQNASKFGIKIFSPHDLIAHLNGCP